MSSVQSGLVSLRKSDFICHSYDVYSVIASDQHNLNETNLNEIKIKILCV